MTGSETSSERLVSYCGIACFICPGFNSEECPGCPELSDCKILQCAQSKNQRYCFHCDEFPCTLHTEGFDWDLDSFPSLRKFQLGVVKWRPYSQEYITLFGLHKKQNDDVMDTTDT